MATKSTGRRLTETRAIELAEQIGELRAELAVLREQVDRRDVIGARLAEALAAACLSTLRSTPPVTPTAPRRRTSL